MKKNKMNPIEKERLKRQKKRDKKNSKELIKKEKKLNKNNKKLKKINEKKIRHDKIKMQKQRRKKLRHDRIKKIKQKTKKIMTFKKEEKNKISSFSLHLLLVSIVGIVNFYIIAGTNIKTIYKVSMPIRNHTLMLIIPILYAIYSILLYIFKKDKVITFYLITSIILNFIVTNLMFKYNIYFLLVLFTSLLLLININLIVKVVINKFKAILFMLIIFAWSLLLTYFYFIAEMI